MELAIFETMARQIDARIERKAATFTDTAEPEYGRTKRVWNVEPMPLEEVRQARKDALAELRWRRECGGIVMHDGSVIATDDRSKTLLNGKYRTAEKYPDRLHRWKGAESEIILTSAQVIAIGDAVSDHVQNCFDRELDLIAEIDAAESAEAVLAIDITTGWPGPEAL
ncbi:DUF4376 domain-containing protein [Azospirillum melinis]|uniref:DUF4376 domain-containing protein n=1 Tax=Azospirillum melinis TaxID=328839 RepID=UPI00375671D8